MTAAAPRYVCIHGHFYQPPRENPWLEAIAVEDSAAPYHDWNERITAECYAPNAAARLVNDERWDRFMRRRERFERNRATLDRTLVRAESGGRISASQLLRQPGVRLESLVDNARLPLDIDRDSASVDMASLETTVKYEGYLRRQEREIERARRDERRRIPRDFPFDRVPGLSKEVVQRLRQVCPDTLGHALRVPGVTPAAVAVLSSYIGRVALHSDPAPVPPA